MLSLRASSYLKCNIESAGGTDNVHRAANPIDRKAFANSKSLTLNLGIVVSYDRPQAGYSHQPVHNELRRRYEIVSLTG